MAKLVKQKYRTLSTGELRINGYMIYCPKDLVMTAFNDDTMDLKITAEKGRLIIETADNEK